MVRPRTTSRTQENDINKPDSPVRTRRSSNARTETSRSKEHAERGRGRSRSRERNSDDAPNKSSKVRELSMTIEDVIVQIT